MVTTVLPSFWYSERLALTRRRILANFQSENEDHWYGTTQSLPLKSPPLFSALINSTIFIEESYKKEQMTLEEFLLKSPAFIRTNYALFLGRLRCVASMITGKITGRRLVCSNK